MITRRELLTSSVAAAGIGAVPQGWLRGLGRANEPRAAGAEPAPPRTDRILVVVLMAGGNDGLNMVVPYADDRYRAARPTLSIDAGKVLRLDDRVGFHPSMKLLRERHEQGEVAVLQGVGYPKPNRSHFRALDIWHSADPEGPPLTGWLGRGADEIDPGGESPAVLTHLGSSIPLALRRARTPILALDNEDSFSIAPDRKYPADKAAQEVAFRELCEPSEAKKPGARPTYAEVVRETAASGMACADEVIACLRKTRNEVPYPKSLGSRLSLVARLINGGMRTRAYFTTLGGFDTHAKQRDTHANLLQNLSESVDALFRDLAAAGRARDVILMTFSEFGRRVAENASGGTDHGAAAPVLLVGPSVKGGLYGSPPDLEHLVDGDIAHSIDFRSVYATLSRGWLGVEAGPVVPGGFPAVPFLAST